MGVLNFLQALVDKSGIIAHLDKERRGEEKFSGCRGLRLQPVQRAPNARCFAPIGLHRVHILLDYTTALKVLDPIDLDKPGIFWVPSVRIPPTTSALRTSCWAVTPTPSAINVARVHQ